MTHVEATPITVTQTPTRRLIQMGDIWVQVFPDGRAVLSGLHGYAPRPLDVGDMVTDLGRLAAATKAAHDGTWTP